MTKGTLLWQIRFTYILQVSGADPSEERVCGTCTMLTNINHLCVNVQRLKCFGLLVKTCPCAPT